MPAAWTDSIAATVSVITAMGALGTASFGLVDATKAFFGGVSNFGLRFVFRALKPFAGALTHANREWRMVVRANWINGRPKDEQKEVVKTLIRLGLRAENADHLAKAGGVDPKALKDAMTALETGQKLTPVQADVFGRFNAVIDASMDAGFERGDQQYRNASKVAAGLFSLGLSWWAAYLLRHAPLSVASNLPASTAANGGFIFSPLFWWASLVGLLAVPVAPIAKDLASSLQAAAKAVKT